jgi:hypothetical protein
MKGQTMTKRFRDARAIQQGACNPIAIVNSLKNAIDECRAVNMGTDQINGDPAVAAMVHQLAHLTGTQYFDQTQYERMMLLVNDAANEELRAQQHANYQTTFGKKVSV